MGGGFAGLATALALAGKGRRVAVLERSDAPPEGPADKVAEMWARPTVPQNDHSHILTSLGVRTLRERAPQVLDAATAAGAVLLDLTRAAPAGFARVAADAELVALAVRRPVLDLVLQRAVRSLPGVTIRYGTTVRGLLLDPSGSRVAGLVTGHGEHIPARMVIDATGRRARSRSWLAAAGRPVPDELTGPTRLRGLSRFYRLTSPEGLPGPLNRGNAAGGIWHHYAAIAHPADNRTFAITLGVPAGDRATAALREPGPFTAVADASPHIAAWTAPGVAVPISPVRPITMPRNVLRGIGTRRPPVAGLISVGDSACVTNPIFGRGMSLALTHAFRLADLLDVCPEPGEGQAERAARLAEEIYRPWYEQAVHDDATRIGRWRAVTGGGPPPPPEPEQAPYGGAPLAAVSAAASADAVVWRALTRVLMSLTSPADAFGDAEVRARVRRASAPVAGPRPPGREELLEAIARAEGSRP